MRRRSGRLNASRSPTFEGEVAGLIRRSPSLVRGRPYPSTDGSAAGFHFHQCPSTTAAVHPEWLPTWLSAEGADKGLERAACQRSRRARSTVSWLKGEPGEDGVRRGRVSWVSTILGTRTSERSIGSRISNADTATSSGGFM